MSSWRRYVRARGVFHDANTAVIAPSSCSRGSSGKSRPVWLAADREELLDELSQRGGVEVDVGVDAPRALRPRERVLEQVARHAEHDVGVHLHEPAVRVGREPLVAGRPRQPARPTADSARGSGSCPSSRASTPASPTAPRREADRRGRRGSFAAALLEGGQVPGHCSSTARPAMRRLPSRYARHAPVVTVNPSGPGGRSRSSRRARRPSRRGRRASRSSRLRRRRRRPLIGREVVARIRPISRPREERWSRGPSFTEHHGDSDGTAEPRARRQTACEAASGGRAVLRTGSRKGPCAGGPSRGRPSPTPTRLRACS